MGVFGRDWQETANRIEAMGKSLRWVIPGSRLLANR